MKTLHLTRSLPAAINAMSSHFVGEVFQTEDIDNRSFNLEAVLRQLKTIPKNFNRRFKLSAADLLNSFVLFLCCRALI